MSEPVSAIRNLGPKSVEMFARAGIHSADELRAMGSEEAYRRLLKSGSRPHFISFYALHMGLQGRPWNDLQGDEKVHLRRIFDEIVASVKGGDEGLSKLEAELNRLGVISGD